MQVRFGQVYSFSPAVRQEVQQVLGAMRQRFNLKPTDEVQDWSSLSQADHPFKHSKVAPLDPQNLVQRIGRLQTQAGSGLSVRGALYYLLTGDEGILNGSMRMLIVPQADKAQQPLLVVTQDQVAHIQSLEAGLPAPQPDGSNKHTWPGPPESYDAMVQQVTDDAKKKQQYTEMSLLA